MEACVIVTYRCNAKCHMCNTWKFPTDINNEVSPKILERLPSTFRFINITGGEPFLRDDIADIIDVLLLKSKRIVISTNGFLNDKIINVAKQYVNRIGFRISLEGLPATNDSLRGLKDGFDHGLRTLLALYDMGYKDIGFGITVSDKNAKDMIELWRLSRAMNLEFATAVTHNSFYFHKDDNEFVDREMIASEFDRLAEDLLLTNRPKNWFRAYFNMGLANKVRGGARLLGCEAGRDVVFIDPHGNVLPCNGSPVPMIMGNLGEDLFEDIVNGPNGERVREQVAKCDRNCWMIGSVSPAIKRQPWVAMPWIFRNLFRVRSHERQTPQCKPLQRPRA